MKKFCFLLFALCLLGALSPSARAANFTVVMINNLYVPAELTIDPGDTVTWSNRVSTLHDTVSYDNVWSSPLFGFRKTYSFTFNVAPGTYAYFCTPHVNLGMVGTIIVRGPPVNNPPTASITSPASGTTIPLGDSVTVVVNAADDAGVSKVELLLDGVVIDQKTTAPYEFSVAPSAGVHSLVARATDGPGLTGNSVPISLTVQAPNQPPSVSISSPANNATLIAPATISIEASAVDDVGIDHVEFFLNDASIGSAATSPYSISKTLPAGAYRISAKAFDTGGLSTTSSEISIQVNEPIPFFPEIAILFPTNNQYVLTNFVLAAVASDADGTIANVQFLEGTNSLGVVTAPAETNRFELATAFSEGRRTITAIATDNQGQATATTPVSFNVVIQPSITSTNVLADGVVRLSVFGTSGVPFVFEYTEDMIAWTPFLTNQLFRRILFFDDLTAADRPTRLYRMRSP